MKLYHLYLIDKEKDGGYDRLEAIVVRAESPLAARQLAQEGQGGHPIWHDESRTKCDELTADGEPGVICADFFEA